MNAILGFTWLLLAVLAVVGIGLQFAFWHSSDAFHRATAFALVSALLSGITYLMWVFTLPVAS